MAPRYADGATAEVKPLEVTERTPYGPGSEHSWILDRAATTNRGIAPDAQERLNQVDMREHPAN
jgi:hypothetical protein